jgi:hypothetical protein
MTSINLLCLLIASFALYAVYLYSVQLREARHEIYNLERELDTLVLDNNILLDELDEAVAFIGAASAKHRHPAYGPKFRVISGGTA